MYYCICDKCDDCMFYRKLGVSIEGRIGMNRSRSSANCTIKDISMLTNITELNICNNNIIEDMSPLTNITKLDIHQTRCIQTPKTFKSNEDLLKHVNKIINKEFK